MKNNRKGTPDIMGGLMISSAVVDQEQVNNKAIKQESNNAAFPDNLNVFKEPASNKTIKQENNKAAYKPVSNKAIIEPIKEKTTFNLSTDTIDSLEEVCFKLKRKLKDGQRITKTRIVEMALKIAFAELEAKNELSDLYLKLKD